MRGFELPQRFTTRLGLFSLAAACTCACAGTIVQPSDLPPAPEPTARGGGTVILVLEGVPTPMAEEVRTFAARMGPTAEARVAGDESLASACGSPEDMVLRPQLGRVHFASNAPDRNTLFIYETAVIVGIPVTLISAVAWPYYAETLVEGELELLDCSDAEPTRRIESFRLRSEGRGFVRTGTLRDAQYDAAVRAVTRELLAVDLE